MSKNDTTPRTHTELPLTPRATLARRGRPAVGAPSRRRGRFGLRALVGGRRHAAH
jgi:hypothetical protein